jgi:hypothetical protein
MEDLTGLRGRREAFVFTSRQYANVKETSVVQNAESQWPTVPRSTLCHGVWLRVANSLIQLVSPLTVPTGSKVEEHDKVPDCAVDSLRREERMGLLLVAPKYEYLVWPR